VFRGPHNQGVFLEQVSEWLHYNCKIADKLSIEADKTQEPM
jgi:hypothetical protein